MLDSVVTGVFKAIRMILLFFGLSIVVAVFASVGKLHKPAIQLNGDTWVCSKSHIEHHESVTIGSVRQPAFDAEECDSYVRKTVT
jgi:hypothetical protein